MPSDAKLGHVVTMLHKDSNQRSNFYGATRSFHHLLFSILDNGAVVTSSDMANLAGQSFYLRLEHQAGDKLWKDSIQVRVGNQESEIYFENQPFFGDVYENQRAYTTVSGLESLYNAGMKLPAECDIGFTGKRGPFELRRESNGGLKLVTAQALDRELVEFYNLVIQARCPHHKDVFAQLRVHIMDENDNIPVFNQEEYTATLIPNLPSKISILEIQASDPDSLDTYGLTYSIEENNIFSVHPQTGSVYLVNPDLLQPMTYDLKVYATDRAGHQSKPATLLIDTLPDIHDSLASLKRFKRETLDPRGWVVRRKDEGDLFTVASIPANPDERFKMQDPHPPMLELDQISGMIRRIPGQDWEPDEDVYEFSVNITRASDPNCESFFRPLQNLSRHPLVDSPYMTEGPPCLNMLLKNGLKILLHLF